MALDTDITKDIESSLKDNFKLSSYESKVYLTLLKRGKQTPKQVSASAMVPMPRIYDTLETLMSKGFVMRQDDSYSPISPRQALRGRSAQFEIQFSQEQRRRKVVEDQVVSILEQSVPRNSTEEPAEISILKGFNAISNKFADLLESSKDIVLVAKRAIEAREVFIPILSEYAGQKNAGKRIRIIVPKGVKITHKEAEKARKANAEIRLSDHVIFDLMITDKNHVIIGVPDPLSDEINHAIAIWVRNPSFASSTRRSVDEIWKSAKRVSSGSLSVG